MKLYNVSREAVETARWLPEGHTLISIGEENEPEGPKIGHLVAQGTPVLRLVFSDCHPGRERGAPKAMSPEEGQQILDFVEEHKANAKGFVVHCWAGVSRSSGIVLALHAIHGWPLPKGFWDASEPNTHVVGTLIKCAKIRETTGAGTGEENSYEATISGIESLAEARKWKEDFPSRCGLCGKPMRHNIPRLGNSGGFVHAETGDFGCGE